jgi:hypothetical protein
MFLCCVNGALWLFFDFQQQQQHNRLHCVHVARCVGVNGTFSQRCLLPVYKGANYMTKRTSGKIRANNALIGQQENV